MWSTRGRLILSGLNAAWSHSAVKNTPRGAPSLQTVVLRSRGIEDPIKELGPLKLFVRREGGRGGRELLNQVEVETWCARYG